MNDDIFTDKIFCVDYGRIFLYPKKSNHLQNKCVKHVYKSVMLLTKLEYVSEVRTQALDRVLSNAS